MKLDYSKMPGTKLDKIEFEEKKYEPIISIITPYYNSQKYIEQTANSILNQTFPFWEWIIIDDQSTETEAITKLEEIKKMDKRIKVLHKKNEGPAAARDYGIERTNKTTKYLAFLDSDDLINKTYLECAYWTLETNPEASWTYTDVINFDGAEFLWRKWFNVYLEQRENLLVMASFVRKDKVKEIGGFKLREKKVYEDWYLWLRLMENGNFPVRMSFLGTWYRTKSEEESELKQSNSQNREKAMQYIKEMQKKLSYVSLKDAIQFPRDTYNWELITDNQNAINYLPKKTKKDKTNILMIIPWMTVGGADKFNFDLISKLDKDKYEITIITTNPNTNEWRLDFEEYATIYDLTSFLERKNWLSFINYIMKSNNIDLIFNTNSEYGYNILPYLKATYPEIPIIDYVHMEEWYWRNGGYSRDTALFSSVIDKTYICNENSRKIVIDIFNKPENEVKTMYIGVDEKKFNPKNYSKQKILKELKIEDNGKYIISYICRIAEQKRPILLMNIIKMLKENRNDFLLIIAGNGPMLTEIKNIAKKYNIDKDIVFLGQVKETEKIYAVSDLTLNCSIKEGLALTAYESLSMGVPVISSDVGGQRELINEEVGVVVPCLQKENEIFNFNYKEEEIKNYVEGINKILNNLKFYKENSRKRILNGFTIDNMIKNMDNEIQQIIKNPNKEKINNGFNLKNNILITKELITRYLISTKNEYEWLCNEFNRQNIDINYKYEQKTNKNVLYENTLEYKIKHPIYVVLKKLHMYDFCKKILNKIIRGEKYII